MTNTATIPKFNSFIDVATLDKNRPRTVVFYGRVSTDVDMPSAKHNT